MKKMNLVLFLFGIVFLVNGVFSLACVNLSLGGATELHMSQGQSQEVELRLYNTSADGGLCETAFYESSIMLLEPVGGKLSDYFDYYFSEGKFELKNTENKQVILNLKPKIKTGNFRLLITATRNPTVTEGTPIIYTASNDFVVLVDEKYKQKEEGIIGFFVNNNYLGGIVIGLSIFFVSFLIFKKRLKDKRVVVDGSESNA